MVRKIKSLLALLLVMALLLGAGTTRAAACGDLLRRVFGCVEEPPVTALATPLLGQNKDQWCWAAASLMAARTYVTNTVTQADIVKKVKGSVINEGGTVYERLAAVKYATGGAVEFKQVPPLTEEEMIASIDAGNPVMLCRGWYPDGKTRYGGHSTVVYGYTMKDGGYLFLIRDPWPVDEGMNELWPYSYIIKGDDTGRLEMCEIKK